MNIEMLKNLRNIRKNIIIYRVGLEKTVENESVEKIRAILELYVDRTPGSFIEEKDFFLVWHY